MPDPVTTALTVVQLSKLAVRLGIGVKEMVAAAKDEGLITDDDIRKERAATQEQVDLFNELVPDEGTPADG